MPIVIATPAGERPQFRRHRCTQKPARAPELGVVVDGEGLEAEVRFTCPHCKREYEPRNAHRFGQSLFDAPESQLTLF